MVVDDPTFVAEDQLRRDALRDAVATAAAADWTDVERDMAAGLLDVLWNVPSFERLVAQWGLGTDDATDTITWAIDLVVAAIRAGNPHDDDRRLPAERRAARQHPPGLDRHRRDGRAACAPTSSTPGSR